MLGAESHAKHQTAARKHQVRTKLSQKALFSKGWDVPVPGQGRLTLEGARRPYRPDLDRLVPAAASDEFAISTEADRIDPVLEISQQVQDGGMNSSKTGNKLTSRSAPPGSTGTPLIRCPRF